MAKETPAQQRTVARVMHEFKHGELKTARGNEMVKDSKQAIAIALHEAGASNQESAPKNRRNLARTKRNEANGATAMADESRAELYAEAKKKGIAGRSRMSKAELQQAIVSTK